MNRLTPAGAKPPRVEIRPVTTTLPFFPELAFRSLIRYATEKPPVAARAAARSRLRQRAAADAGAREIGDLDDMASNDVDVDGGAEAAVGAGRLLQDVAIDRDPRAGDGPAADEQPAARDLGVVAGREPGAHRDRPARRKPCPARRPRRERARRAGLAVGVDITLGGSAAADAARVSADGGDDCCWLPPIAKTCSSAATPPFDEVGVPPTVIARYSLPPLR